MWILRLLGSLLLIIALTIIVLQNIKEDVTVTVFSWQFVNKPLPLVILLSIALGMVVTFFINIFHELSLRRRIWAQKKKIDNLTVELTALRNLPLAEAEEKSSEKEETKKGE
ncbi:MAG: LapA family protein [Candidatus Edwardsbacteria bacterium]